MTLHYAYNEFRQSDGGWRLTFYDAHGDPVASFWALTKSRVCKDASKYRQFHVVISS